MEEIPGMRKIFQFSILIFTGLMLAGGCTTLQKRDMVPVESDVINAVKYLPKKQLLRVETSDGQLLQYREVPPSVYEGLVSSRSPGSYYHMRIKSLYQLKSHK